VSATRIASTAPRWCGIGTSASTESAAAAGNVIAGEARASLDVRHSVDEVRIRVVSRLIQAARDVAGRRGLIAHCETRLDQPAVLCDPGLTTALERAVQAAGYPVHRLVSGAGHDAMILAAKTPVSMLFLRSPGGISHHPDESVHGDDVDAALQAGLRFLETI